MNEHRTMPHTTKPIQPHEPLALSLSAVRAGYDEHVVLRDVTISIPTGSVVALLGPNGAGKSTLCKVASGSLPLLSGSISMNGTDVTSLPSYQRVRRGMCYVPEGHAVYRSLTVKENVTMQAAKRDAPNALEQAATLFPKLAQRWDQRAGTLSGGEQQMLAMVRAFIANPSVVVIDEPSLGLAPLVVDSIFELLQNELAQARRTSILLIDQFVGRVLEVADTVHVLRRGTICYSGPSGELSQEELYEHYVTSTAVA